MNVRSPASRFAVAACLAMLAACADKSPEPARDAPAPAADAGAAAVDPAAPAATADASEGDPSAGAPAVAIALRATGNEPFWRIDMGATEVVLTTPDGEVRAGAPTIDATFADGAVLYVAAGAGGDIAVKTLDAVCVDSMTGMPHPLRVQAWVGGRELSGCGGDPASLLQGAEWTVDEIAGAPLVKDSSVTLNFGTDGSLSGASSCNRFMTGYELTGEGLSIKQGAGSMMMCEDPLMAQEGAFLALLAAVNRFEIAPDGALHLKTADGRSIRARR
jgi:heat shock protein HslJ